MTDSGTITPKRPNGWLRWALVTVPAIVLLGLLSARLGDSGYGNPWFDRLIKPEIMPPGWAFPVAWTTLYILMGFALALILDARGARWRGIAIALFLFQLALNMAWSPVFFGLHRIMLALGLIIAGTVHVLFADRATKTAQLAYAVFTPEPTFSFLGFRNPVLWLILGGIVVMSLIAITPPLLRNIRRNPIKDMRDE